MHDERVIEPPVQGRTLDPPRSSVVAVLLGGLLVNGIGKFMAIVMIVVFFWTFASRQYELQHIHIHPEVAAYRVFTSTPFRISIFMAHVFLNFAAGYVAAWWARRRPVAHGLAAGALSLGLAPLFFRTAEPLWWTVLHLVVVLPLTAWGGHFEGQRSQAGAETNPFRYFWGLLRVASVNGAYITGMPEDSFRLWKGRIWAEIDHYERAIQHYRKALAEEDSFEVRYMLAWCHGCLDQRQESVDHLRPAYKKYRHPEIGLYLALAECGAGNFTESQALVDSLDQSAEDLDPEHLEVIAELQQAIRERRTDFDWDFSDSVTTDFPE